MCVYAPAKIMNSPVSFETAVDSTHETKMDTHLHLHTWRFTYPQVTRQAAVLYQSQLFFSLACSHVSSPIGGNHPILITRRPRGVEESQPVSSVDCEIPLFVIT